MRRRPPELPLRDELEIACMDALGGDPPGPMLARRLERDCTAVLARRGISGARVAARSDAGGTFVQVWLPRPDRTVEKVVLTLG